jgi:hypothetical protein
VDFSHEYAKNPDYPACFGSLQGKKPPARRFLVVLSAKARQTAGSLLRLLVFASLCAARATIYGLPWQFAG